MHALRQIASEQGITGRRKLLAVVVATPVLATLVASALLTLQGATRELACWVLPNARVLVVPGDDDCPLRLHDQIRRVAVGGGRIAAVGSSEQILEVLPEAGSSLRVSVAGGGREHWVEIPIREVSSATRVGRVAVAALLAGALLSIPLFLLWRSAWRAAVPFALLYSAAAVGTLALICGRHSEWLTRTLLLAMVSAPAIVAHLSFTFPTERRVLRHRPEIAGLPYLATLLLVPMGWFALERDSLVWPSFMYLVLALTAGAWAILILSCGFAVRESTSAVERARARVLCYGALLLPLLPTLWLAREGTDLPAKATAYLWISAIVMPLPIGLAISHYNLFDLGSDVRRLTGRLVYLGTAASVVTLVLEVSFRTAGAPEPLQSRALVFLVSLACVAAVEPLRGRMLGLLEAMLSPRLNQLRELREEYEREMAQLDEEEAVAGRLGGVLQAALGPPAGCVFLSDGREWRPAHLFGAGAPARISLVPEALSALGTRSLVHLALAPEEAPLRPELRAAGLELVAAVQSGGERFGLVLLTTRGRRSPYTGADLDFVAAATSQAGIALRNARMTEELLSVERHAATGRVALSLAHDLGKELDWMRRIVKRLPERFDDRMRLERDVSMLQEFAEGISEGLRNFVCNATAPTLEFPGALKFDELIERIARRMTRVHGRDRITQTIDPAVQNLPCRQSLSRVISNLLDNALHVTPKGGPVELFATLEDGWMQIVVADSGPGLSQEMLREVFKPGFTTRTAEGGLGIGLTVAREIIGGLGGTIELTPNPRAGMRATVRVPAELQELTCV